jgi:mRNA-degrading endonuclease toxin of MazEF toxin-antitoxin module
MVRYAFGEIVIVSGGAYTSKPRPVLIFQNEGSYTGESVIVIPFTTTCNEEVKTRIALSPSMQNGLDRACFLEVDKLSAINIAHIGGKIGVLEDDIIDEAKSIARELLMLS